ncbi:MAG: hypothetical protein HY099_01310, partial [Nitrospirae bacterium]|nr:hypothetical protein [Nitrospirota bacterium]
MKKLLIIILAVVMLAAVSSLLYASDYIENMVATTAKSKYVGAKVCAGCHKDHYNGWVTTLHPYKVRPANENSVVGDFVKNNNMVAKGIKGFQNTTEYTTKMSAK